MAHTRQSRPDYGLGLKAEVPTLFEGVPFLFGSGSVLAFLVSHTAEVFQHHETKKELPERKTHCRTLLAKR